MSASDAAPLATRIRQKIAAEGPISLADYMARCLGDPAEGYYRRRAPLGAEGDFVTAAEISQIFGELIGLWLASEWLALGRPSPVALVELGPGRGVLMADALRAARRAPDFAAAVRLFLVESSEPLRAEQAQRLAAEPSLTAPPQWLERLEQAPNAPLLLVANEFFDALPIRQYRREAGLWRETLVDVAAEDPARFAATLGTPSTLQEAARFPEAADGAVLEVSAAGEAVAGEIGRRLRAHPGAALIIDYGYDAAQRARAGGRDTFQAVAQHSFADPFVEPGRRDLTAHVDFDALAAAAGVPRAGPIGQGRFLTALGAETRAMALARAAPEKAATVARGLKRLTHPREMGALYKAMALKSPGAAAPVGFETEA